MAVVQIGSTTVTPMLRRLFVLLLPFALVLGACSDDDDEPAGKTTTTKRTSTSATATSSTSAPQPGPGSTGTTSATGGPSRTLTGSGGTGKLSWSVVPDRSEFCYRISLDSRSSASAARLYRGRTGATGDVVLELVPP